MFTLVKTLAKRWYDKILAVAFDNSDFLKRTWAKTIQKREGDISFAPLPPSLSQVKIALLTTGGFHHKDQQPFDMSDPKGDPSYREINLSLPPEASQITHDYYDHKDAESDRNVVFPVERMQELAQEGILGSLHPVGYSFMGHLLDSTHIPRMEQNAREVAHKLKTARVNAALITPA